MISPDYGCSKHPQTSHRSTDRKSCSILHRRDISGRLLGGKCTQCKKSNRILLGVSDWSPDDCFGKGYMFALCLKCIRRGNTERLEKFWPIVDKGYIHGPESLFEPFDAACGYCNPKGPYYSGEQSCTMYGVYDDSYNYSGFCNGCLQLFDEILSEAYLIKGKKHEIYFNNYDFSGGDNLFW